MQVRRVVVYTVFSMVSGLGTAITGWTAASQPDIVLITLDTTRADHLDAATMPTVWKLASAGTRYSSAWSPSPLTLPAHASLLTGRLPPHHGLRANGIGTLPADVPTLAETLSSHGYATAAVVASLVLDRRFGLDRGFHRYNDAMDSRRTGEYGYAERGAEEVVDAAFSLWAKLRNGPRFLWVHFYDAHHPYTPEGGGGRSCGSPARCYRREVAEVDQQVSRLLAGLHSPSPKGGQRPRLVVVVGDHGESLNEHGEETHGIFLYGSTLRVPLVLSGYGVKAGTVESETISTHQVSRLVLRALALPQQQLASAESRALVPGVVFPRVETSGSRPTDAEFIAPVFAEALMPRDTFGWAPLRSLTQGSWRYIERKLPGGRQELFEVSVDPRETHNLIDERPAVAQRMAGALLRLGNTFPKVGSEDPSQGHRSTTTGATSAEKDEQAQLRSRLGALGYVVAGPRSQHDGIDPVVGVAWMQEVERAKRVLAADPDTSEVQRQLLLLRRLARKNPNNVPLLGQLSTAQWMAGNYRAALVSVQRALELAPDSEFSHLRLASVFERLGRTSEALAAYRRVVQLNPRSYLATLALAQRVASKGDSKEEADILAAAIDAGLVSPPLELRLGTILLEQGFADRARRVLERLISASPGAPEADRAAILLVRR